ncbi:hypothetical protein [Streptomyces sp. NPDC056227]|uniref:hypothetical protein n=1 Tax=Streptomyces sp. NPDC056227 TaxID=3345753 RepID=UPI0035DE07EE
MKTIPMGVAAAVVAALVLTGCGRETAQVRTAQSAPRSSVQPSSRPAAWPDLRPQLDSALKAAGIGTQDAPARWEPGDTGDCLHAMAPGIPSGSRTERTRAVVKLLEHAGWKVAAGGAAAVNVDLRQPGWTLRIRDYSAADESGQREPEMMTLAVSREDCDTVN